MQRNVMSSVSRDFDIQQAVPSKIYFMVTVPRLPETILSWNIWWSREDILKSKSALCTVLPENWDEWIEFSSVFYAGFFLFWFLFLDFTLFFSNFSECSMSKANTEVAADSLSLANIGLNSFFNDKKHNLEFHIRLCRSDLDVWCRVLWCFHASETKAHWGLLFQKASRPRALANFECFLSSRISQRLQRKEPWHRFTAEAKLPPLPSSCLTPALNSLCAPPVLPFQLTSSRPIRQPLLFYPPPITPSLHYLCLRALALLVFAADLAAALRCSRGGCINSLVFVPCVLSARCLGQRALGLSRWEPSETLVFLHGTCASAPGSTQHLSIAGRIRKPCFAAQCQGIVSSLLSESFKRYYVLMKGNKRNLLLVGKMYSHNPDTHQVLLCCCLFCFFYVFVNK